MTMARIPLWILLAGAMITAASCGAARRGSSLPEPMQFASAEAASGEVYFMRICNQCHPRGEAGLAPGIIDKPLPAFLIRTQVRNGLGAMPAFSQAEITDGQLDAIIAYLGELRRQYAD
jgi:mono/diheme cytochrome c family protein